MATPDAGASLPGVSQGEAAHRQVVVRDQDGEGVDRETPGSRDGLEDPVNSYLAAGPLDEEEMVHVRRIGRHIYGT